MSLYGDSPPNTYAQLPPFVRTFSDTRYNIQTNNKGFTG